jgi:asparagine synthase (glutamine-hydrolysing)
LASAADAAKIATVIYKAVMGDAMMGTALTRHFWAEYEGDNVDKFHIQAYKDRGVLLFTTQDQERLFTDSFHTEVNGAVADDYRRGIAASGATQVADQRLFFDLRHRIPRMTWNGVELVRSQAVVRTPYSDNDLLEFSLTVPPGLRLERHLMKRALLDHYPKLAQIPLTENNLPLVACARDVLIRSQRVAAWHLHQLGLRRSPHISSRPYSNSNLWFRTVLRGWVTDTLLSPRTLERGYFNPNFVRRLVEEHMNGMNHSTRLGALLSLELWHRQFLD